MFGVEVEIYLFCIVEDSNEYNDFVVIYFDVVVEMFEVILEWCNFYFVVGICNELVFLPGWCAFCDWVDYLVVVEAL